MDTVTRAQGGKGNILIWTVPAPQGKWEEQREGDSSSHSPFILEGAGGELIGILSFFAATVSAKIDEKTIFPLAHRKDS